MERPWYDYGPQLSGKYISDNAFYNGWSGGTLSATPPYQGTLLTSREVADKICQDHFGSDSRIAEHHDGWYMNFMNFPPNPSPPNPWQWTKTGGWSLWG